MFQSSGYFKGVNCPYFSSGLCERPYCHLRHVKVDAPAKPAPAVSAHTASGSSDTVSVVGGVDTSRVYSQSKSLASNSVQYQPTPIHLLRQAINNNIGQEYDPVLNFSSSARAALPAVKLSPTDYPPAAATQSTIDTCTALPADSNNTVDLSTHRAAAVTEAKLYCNDVTVVSDVDRKLNCDASGSTGLQSNLSIAVKSHGKTVDHKSSCVMLVEGSESDVTASAETSPSDVTSNKSSVCPDNNNLSMSSYKTNNKNNGRGSSSRSRDKTHDGKISTVRSHDKRHSRSHDKTPDGKIIADRLHNKTHDQLHDKSLDGKSSADRSHDKMRDGQTIVSQSESLDKTHDIVVSSWSCSRDSTEPNISHRTHDSKADKSLRSGHQMQTSSTSSCSKLNKEKNVTEQHSAKKYKLDESASLLITSQLSESDFSHSASSLSKSHSCSKYSRTCTFVDIDDGLSVSSQQSVSDTNRTTSAGPTGCFGNIESRQIAQQSNITLKHSIQQHNQKLQKTGSEVVTDVGEADIMTCNKSRTLNYSDSQLHNKHSHHTSKSHTSHNEHSHNNKSRKSSRISAADLNITKKPCAESSVRHQPCAESSVRHHTDSKHDIITTETLCKTSSTTNKHHHETVNSVEKCLSANFKKAGLVSKNNSSHMKTSAKISNVDLFGDDSDNEIEKSQIPVQHSLSNTKITNRQCSVNSKMANKQFSTNTKAVNKGFSSGQSNSRLQLNCLSDDEEIIVSAVDSDCDDNEIFEQCQQLYNEEFARQDDVSGNIVTAHHTNENKLVSLTNSQPVGRKRLAHTSTVGLLMKMKSVSAAKKIRINPAAEMLHRYETVQNMLLPTQSTSDTKSTQQQLKTATTTTTTTTATTTGVSKSRVAHVPKIAVLKKPILSPDANCKIPLTVRQQYLNRLFDECVKIYDNEQDAQQRALSEERSVNDRSTTKSVYLNLAINALRRLREESASEDSERVVSPTTNSRLTLSHEFVLGGPKACHTSFTLNRSAKQTANIATTFTGAVIYSCLKRYVLSEDQLMDNGYPRSDPTSRGTVTIKIPAQDKGNNVLPSSNTNEKICCRCGRRFIIFPDGTFATKEQCVYHWGKAWKKRIAGAIENYYTCCQGDLNTKGCQVALCHVHEHNKFTSLTGYVKTMPCSPCSDGNYSVYALDCEMVYTTAGSELARITVVDPLLRTVYETLVRPEHRILDYNSRFSGITEKDLLNVSTRLRDVHAVLLSLFNDKTILIGHSLESDLTAIKLVHSTVVDTSIVFPHRLGLPFKRALRTLAAEILQRIIQNDVEGHDSCEDAKTCMELMLRQIKEDAKKEFRR